jgi:hypothetical protein
MFFIEKYFITNLVVLCTYLKKTLSYYIIGIHIKIYNNNYNIVQEVIECCQTKIFGTQIYIIYNNDRNRTQ